MVHVLQKVKNVYHWFEDVTFRELAFLLSQAGIIATILYLAIIYVLPAMGQGSVPI